jgi:DNA-binding NtrC family response regulator
MVNREKLAESRGEEAREGVPSGPSCETTRLDVLTFTNLESGETLESLRVTRNERSRRPSGEETLRGGRLAPVTELELQEVPYREPKALRVQREGVEDLIVPLYPDRSYVFGRAPESTVVFAHAAVSRQHGRLSFREDHRWVYRDLNSRNRSFLGRSSGNFQQISASRDWILEAGDVVLLGNDGKSRIALLAEVPHGLVAGARSTRQAVSPAMAQLERSIEVCARHHLPVFLLGKSGTGKTFIAREIHSRSRLDGKFVILNCGRLPQDTAALTSELLGHVKGAFTGASLARVGKLYSADGGTLFLDEVEFLPRLAQDFLIDILEGTGSPAPLGAPADFREPPPRIRLISASKLPLRQTGLRPDLTHRLAAGDVILLPTLEERREDIPNLVEAFLHRLKVEQQYDARLTSDAIAYLQKADWPGQIRELESTVRAVVAREVAQQSIEGIENRRTVISLEAVKTYLSQRQLGFGRPALTPVPLAEVTALVRKRPSDLTEQDLRAVLAKHQGVKSRAAAELDIAVNTLKAKMKAFGIE